MFDIDHFDSNFDTSAKVESFTRRLSDRLQSMQELTYPPEARKEFTRTFSTTDLVRLLGVPDSTLRTLTLEGKGPQPDRAENNRRIYSIDKVWQLRTFLAEHRPDDALKFLPWRREGEKLQVVAAANFKGGSSKTTTSVHLAHYLALQGYRVLCVDLDPQASMTTTFGIQPDRDLRSGHGEDERTDTVYDALRYDNHRVAFSDVIRETYFPGIHLVCGNLRLMDFEYDTPTALVDRNTDELGLFFQRLDAAIQTVEENYDVVVLDTPPSLGYMTLAALYAATGLIITVHPAMLDVSSCSQFLKMISDVTHTLAEGGAVFEHDFTKFLLTRVNPNDGPQKIMSGTMRDLFGTDVLISEAIESTAIASAGVAKKTLYEIESGEIGRETLKRAVESIDQVNGEILGMIKQVWGREV
ncbi:plasmid partitioning protein RepA [Roseibium sp. RKSG952]|uniref:plasmid partitioning protein RepA n=1 Tax=Roseibium sp. RKSG952 TaxID=2529384 RepID=UPI0012BBCF38|nr:plasmid partitioning protein RepA [Roseibium sp. RKSG952]MTH95039.1 plasmid partitioning protein RepA [Roseibium sp. RKSG952]